MRRAGLTRRGPAWAGRTPTRRRAPPGPGTLKERGSDLFGEAQADIAMVLGSEAAARLSRWLVIPVSSDTVLRLIRRYKTASSPPQRVVGIDDWAWRRGRSYGTIRLDAGKALMIGAEAVRGVESNRVVVERTFAYRIGHGTASGMPVGEFAKMSRN